MRLAPKEILNDPITDHIHRDVPRLQAEMTVQQALDSLRTNPPTSRIIYFYVLDFAGKLLGVLPTRRLILSPADQPIREIMVRRLVTLPAEATVLDACEFFIQHKILALPVIDSEGKLLGVADVELYTEEAMHFGENHTRDDLFQLIGVHWNEAQAHSPVAAVKSRFPWLICNIVGGLLAAVLTGIFEEDLARTVALALFLPVVLALAESVTIQSVTLTLQALHSGKPSWRKLFVAIGQEMLTGLGLGLLCGLVIAGVCILWLGKWSVAYSLLGGIGIGVTLAATFGVAVPNLLRLFRVEPGLAAGPIALTASDIVTLLAYFSLARMFT